jgi:hypothetical protein
VGIPPRAAQVHSVHKGCEAHPHCGPPGARSENADRVYARQLHKSRKHRRRARDGNECSVHRQ